MRLILAVSSFVFISFSGLACAESWPDLSRPAPSVGGGEHDAAVIVGAEKYFALPAVAGAGSNALAWYDYLYKTRGVPAANIILMRDNEAVADEIKAAAAQAAGLAGEDGTLWFVFIGHGAPDADSKDGLLIGVDAQQTARGLKSRSLAQKELVSVLGKTKARGVVVILDACFSGRDEGGQELVKGLQPVVVINTGEKLDSRFALLTAAKANEFAGRLPGVERPAFSYLALGAVRGWAGADASGHIRAGAVQRYVEGAFRATVRDRSQHPTISGNEELVIGKSAGEQGPDIGEIAKASSGRAHAVSFKVSELPEMPRVTAPGALTEMPKVSMPGAIGKEEGVDFASMDVDALGKYDEVVKFDGSNASAEQKAEKWRALGSDIRTYRDMARKRAEEWAAVDAQEAMNAMLANDKGPDSALEKADRWKTFGKKYRQYREMADSRVADWKRYAKELGKASDAREKRVELRERDWAKLKKLLAYSVVSERDKQAFALSFVKAYGWNITDNSHLLHVLAFLPADTLRSQAEKGDASAQYLYATMLINGLGIRKNPEEAVSWYARSAEQGNSDAQGMLAQAYAYGLGAVKDCGKALEWIQKSLAQGNANSQVKMGSMRYSGVCVSADAAAAFKWYMRAAEQGNSIAQLDLGIVYRTGNGAPQNYEEAVKWYLKAVEQGNTDAMVDLGYMHDNGLGFDKSLEEGIRYYRMSAEGGNAIGQSNMGNAYFNGRGVPKDYGEAVKWYRRAAEQGYVQAQHNLGNIYKEGKGIPANLEESVKWYAKAAEQGDVQSLLALGNMYENGTGVAKDSDKALVLYRKAAERGDIWAKQGVSRLEAAKKSAPASGTETTGKAAESAAPAGNSGPPSGTRQRMRGAD